MCVLSREHSANTCLYGRINIHERSASLIHQRDEKERAILADELKNYFCLFTQLSRIMSKSESAVRNYACFVFLLTRNFPKHTQTSERKLLIHYGNNFYPHAPSYILDVDC
jgi:hypothetical protein